MSNASRKDVSANTQARSPRGRPPKGASLLSPDLITQAAMEEIAQVGLAALSVRSVARRLGVDPKSLYNHVDGKDGLLDAVTDYILSTIQLPTATGSLDDDLRAFAKAFRAHALRYPEAASLVMTRQTRSPASLIPLEAALSALLDAGFDPPTAVHYLRMVMAMLVGAVLREAESGLTFGATDLAGVEERRAVLAASGLPALQAAADEIAIIDNDAEFEFALDEMVRLLAEGRNRLSD